MFVELALLEEEIACPKMNYCTAHLRPTTLDDLDFVLAAEHTAHQAELVRLWSRDRHCQAIHDSDERHWMVEDAKTQTRVGYVIMQGIKDPNQCLHVKRIVITQASRGYGRSALEQVLQRAFLEFAAHRVWLDVMEDNSAARSLYRHLGFVEEGRLRECVKTRRGFASMWVMAMVRSDFLATYGNR